MKYSTDGSILVTVDDGLGAIGLFDTEGRLRLNTQGGSATGLYSPNGEFYAEISSDDEAASGTGRYNPRGWLRCSNPSSDFFGETGIYGTDGSLRVTVPV